MPYLQDAQGLGLIDVVSISPNPYLAILMRLHTESSHPCLRLCTQLPNQAEALCSHPAVVVDASLALLGENTGSRQQGSFLCLSHYR